MNEIYLSGNLTNNTLGAMQSLAIRGRADPSIRKLARKIIEGVPNKDYSGEVAAVTQWIRDNIRYTRDPFQRETVQAAHVTLRDGHGDCDDMSILGASLLGSIGHNTQFKIVGKDKPAHVFIEVNIPGRGWIISDPTVQKDYTKLPPGYRAIQIAGMPESRGVHGMKPKTNQAQNRAQDRIEKFQAIQTRLQGKTDLNKKQQERLALASGKVIDLTARLTNPLANIDARISAIKDKLQNAQMRYQKAPGMMKPQIAAEINQLKKQLHGLMRLKRSGDSTTALGSAIEEMTDAPAAITVSETPKMGFKRGGIKVKSVIPIGTLPPMDINRYAALKTNRAGQVIITPVNDEIEDTLTGYDEVEFSDGELSGIFDSVTDMFKKTAKKFTKPKKLMKMGSSFIPGGDVAFGVAKGFMGGSKSKKGKGKNAARKKAKMLIKQQQKAARQALMSMPPGPERQQMKLALRDQQKAERQEWTQAYGISPEAAAGVVMGGAPGTMDTATYSAESEAYAPSAEIEGEIMAAEEAETVSSKEKPIYKKPVFIVGVGAAALLVILRMKKVI